MQLLNETDIQQLQKLCSKPQPRGDTQINRNGLIEDVRVHWKYA